MKADHLTIGVRWNSFSALLLNHIIMNSTYKHLRSKLQIKPWGPLKSHVFEQDINTFFFLIFIFFSSGVYVRPLILCVHVGKVVQLSLRVRWTEHTHQHKQAKLSIFREFYVHYCYGGYSNTAHNTIFSISLISVLY